MRITGRLPMLATLALLLAGSATAQQAKPMQHDMHDMSGAGMSGAGKGGDADAAMMAGMEQMQRAMMAAPTTGDADRDFVAMMLPHHRGAADMANAVLTYGKDPEIRRLAAAIVAAQQAEIAQMERWQAAHAAK